jgi:hypothetical protein
VDPVKASRKQHSRRCLDQVSMQLDSDLKSVTHTVSCAKLSSSLKHIQLQLTISPFDCCTCNYICRWRSSCDCWWLVRLEHMFCNVRRWHSKPHLHQPCSFKRRRNLQWSSFASMQHQCVPSCKHRLCHQVFRAELPVYCCLLRGQICWLLHHAQYRSILHQGRFAQTHSAKVRKQVVTACSYRRRLLSVLVFAV